jgi:O-antigen/teichoic acid export membrane protein
MDDEALVNTISGEPAPKAPPNAVSGVARGSALNLVGSAVTAVLSFVVVAIITRGMDQADAGIVFTATSLFVVVESIARLGADGGIVHHVAGQLAQGRRIMASNVLLASLIPVAIGSSLVGIAMIAAAIPIESLVVPAHSGQGLLIVVILGVVMPFAATYDVVAAATRALGVQRPTVLVERLFRPTTQVVAVAVTILLGGNAAAVTGAWLLPYIVTFVIMLLWLRRLMNRAAVPLWSAAWRTSMRSVWTFTAPRAVASAMQNALQRLDIVLVSAIISLPAAAIYTGATRFVVVGQLGNQAVSYTMQPELRRFIVRSERQAAFEVFQASTTWIVIVTWPLYLVVISMAPLVLRLFGAHYVGGENSTIIVTAAMLVASACGLVDIALITVGKSTWNLANVALGLTVNVALDLILLPRIGIEGAAIGWAVAIILCNIVPLWQIYGLSGLHPVSKPWAAVMIVAIVSFLALPEAGRALYNKHWVGALVGLAIGGAAYAIFLWRSRASLRLDELVRSRRRGKSGVEHPVGDAQPEVG